MNKRAVGALYEKRAAAFLEEQGLTVQKRNYRCPAGEIDLVVLDGDCLVFVEVKYRAGKGQGGPFSAVNREKQRRISRAAAWYLMKEVGREDVPCRFDVLGMEGRHIRWMKNAFDAC